jgi:hypothetical protein
MADYYRRKPIAIDRKIWYNNSTEKGASAS